jgi:hypothetical protein
VVGVGNDGGVGQPSAPPGLLLGEPSQHVVVHHLTPLAFKWAGGRSTVGAVGEGRGNIGGW